MKKGLMLTVIILLGIIGTDAQAIVKIRPVAPIVVKPVCPSPHHVWVGGPGNGIARQETMYGWRVIGHNRESMVHFG